MFLQLPLALGLACCSTSAGCAGADFLRLAFFSPNLIGQVFVGVLFSVLFVPQYGLVNRVLHFLFTAFPLDTKWLSNPAW